jgi:hypothetical protein
MDSLTSSHCYQSQYDQLKRKALLNPSLLSTAAGSLGNSSIEQPIIMQPEEGSGFTRANAGLAGFGSLSVNDVVNNMEAVGVWCITCLPNHHLLSFRSKGHLLDHSMGNL